MRLTKKKAIEISVELWEYMAKSGSDNKRSWEGWETYGPMEACCPFCEYDCRNETYADDKICVHCPLSLGESGCYQTPYLQWCEAYDKASRKKYAAKFLEVLKGLQ